MVPLVGRVPGRVRPGPAAVLDVGARPAGRRRLRVRRRVADTRARDAAAVRVREEDVRRVGHSAHGPRVRAACPVAAPGRVRPWHGTVLQQPGRVAGRGRPGAAIVRARAARQRRGCAGRIRRRQRREVRTHPGYPLVPCSLHQCRAAERN